MKKHKILILIFVVLIFCAGLFSFCGDDNSPNNPANTNATTNTVTIVENPLSYVYYSYTGIPLALNSDDLANSSKTVTQYSWDFQNDGNYDITDSSSKTTKVFDNAGTQEMLLKIDYNDNTFDKIKIYNIVKDSSLNHKRVVWEEFGGYD